MTTTTFPLGRAALAAFAALVLTIVVSSATDKPGDANDPFVAEAMNLAGVALAGVLLVIGLLALVRKINQSG